MKTQAPLLLAASALLAPTSVLATDPRRMRSDPREDTINGAKNSVHRHRHRRRRRNESIRLAQRSLDSESSNEGFEVVERRRNANVHSNDFLLNTMQEEEITVATFKYGAPEKRTDTVMTMDDTFSMPAVDGFVLLPFQESTINVDAELGLGLELPTEFGRMSMPLDTLETAPIILNEMSMEFNDPSFSADGENGSTTAATMAASSGETITTTTASKESKMLPPSPSDATLTTSTVASIEEEDPEDMITIVGEHLPSSSSMNSPIVIATVVAGSLFMMW
mmetsp:Transcript_2798/g.5063  ORF Transcript_2798/g.5063 Transcript_2798/m.5063 type:complete len:279 (-) Transcript_2798:256-1092(-)